ncbi:MAG: DUF4230 domain-containing protein [Cyanobacteria bacterium J06598_1]
MKSRMPDPYRQKTVLRRSHKPNQKPRSPFRPLQFLAIATTGGAVMLASLAGLAFLRSGSQFVEGLKLAITPKPPEEKVDVRTVVVEQVREVSELTTAVFTMEAVVPTQSDRKLGEYTIGQTNLLYVAYGEVRAGVDLEALEKADVITTEAGTQITLTLPPPKVLDTKIDVERSEVYDYSRGFFNLGPDRAPELQSMAARAAAKKIECAAYEQDILGQANDRAELVVSKLLQSVGFDNVIVETSPGAVSTTCAAS